MKAPWDWSTPWTAEQCEILNSRQRDPYRHPYTCPNRDDGEHELFRSVNGGELGQLIARPDGWHCPTCGYTQDVAKD